MKHSLLSALEFYQTILLPTLEEYKIEPTDRRRCYLACIIVASLKDYIKKELGQKIEKEIRDENPIAYDIVISVSNGAKHQTITRTRKIDYDAGDDFERTPAIYGKMIYGISHYGDYKGGREIVHSGKRYDILQNIEKFVQIYERLYPDILGIKKDF